MTEAEQIFKKYIGLNTELGYLPYKKENIINAINEALNIQYVSNRRELLIACVRTCLKDKDSITVEQQVDNFLLLKPTKYEDDDLDLPF